MAYPATFADLKTSLISMVRLDATDDATKAGQWINETYFEVATETRFNRTSRTDVLTSSSTLTVNAAVHEIEAITCTPTGGTASPPLKEENLDTILGLRALNPSSVGTPTRYALEPLSTLHLWPTPAGGETLTTYYAALLTALSAVGDIPLIPEPHASKLLLYGPAVKAAEWKRDLLMLGEFQQQYAAALAGFQRYLNRKGGAYPASFPVKMPGREWMPADPSVDVPVYGG